jgi:hypothetical protein
MTINATIRIAFTIQMVTSAHRQKDERGGKSRDLSEQPEIHTQERENEADSFVAEHAGVMITLKVGVPTISFEGSPTVAGYMKPRSHWTTANV